MITHPIFLLKATAARLLASKATFVGRQTIISIKKAIILDKCISSPLIP